MNRQTVLIVDDERINIDILCEDLGGKYTIVVAQNGEQALNRVSQNPIDLILLDIIMPVMDGYEVCRRLKANPETKDIPIIFITVREDIDDKVNAFSMGGVDYITKPFHSLEVLARVKTHLDLYNLQREREQIVADLKKALADIKTLRGFIPICSNCKSIRDDEGYWEQIEDYIAQHSEANFTHGICPTCARLLYPNYKLTDDPGKS